MTGFLRIKSDQLAADISPFGAALARLRIKGHETSLVLGLPRAEDYRDAPHAIGVIVGPIAGRIGHAHVRLNDRAYKMDANAPPHALHSGPNGVQHRHWDVVAHTETALSLRCTLPDGACGLPGNRTLEVNYTVEGADLILQIETTSDADTYVNATSHAYWSLDGSGTLAAHELSVSATEMISTGADLVPTGHLTRLSGTPCDYALPRHLENDTALDGTFCLSGGPAMTLASSRSGVKLTLETNQPGLVLYTGAGLPRLPAPEFTPPIAPFSALAIEPQGWPDAPNHADFPSILLRAGEKRSQISRFRLDCS